MLSLRLKRTGRKGYAQYRLVAQDSRLSPTSGKVAAYLGNYDPHSKAVKIDKEKIEYYLGVGAQPSTRVVSLLNKEGVKLPKWVAKAPKKQRAIRHPEKLRKNQPKEEAKPAEEAPPVTAETGSDESAETKPEADKADTAEPEAESTEAGEAKASTPSEAEAAADEKPPKDEKPADEKPKGEKAES